MPRIPEWFDFKWSGIDTTVLEPVSGRERFDSLRECGPVGFLEECERFNIQFPKQKSGRHKIPTSETFFDPVMNIKRKADPEEPAELSDSGEVTAESEGIEEI